MTMTSRPRTAQMDELSKAVSDSSHFSFEGATTMVDKAACPSCAIAAHTPDTPHQHADCKGCAVRALAQGPQFHASGVDGAISKGYRVALAQIFGDDWRAGHALVKAEADRIREARKA